MEETQEAVIIRDNKGRFAPGTRTGAPITKANSSDYRRRRQEKTARLLRESITVETADKLVMTSKPTAPEAVAAAGGILWRDVVLDAGAYPRDRLDAWRTIGQIAEVIADPKQQQVAVLPQAAGYDLVAVIMRRRLDAGDVIDAQATDAETET